MSLPGIFRRLFENEGAGPRLLKAILPFHADTHGAEGSDPITPESIGAMAANAKPGSASSADVAVKLKTSRAIDGMGFDGTRSIIHYAVCSTAAATAAKTVNLTGFVLEIGARILVRFDTTNTAVNPTLNVTGTGAKAIRYKNATVAASVLAAKAIREFVYDGAYWQIVGDLDSNTTYGAASTDKAGIVQLSDAVNSTASTTAATSKAVKNAYDKANSAASAANAAQSAATVANTAAGMAQDTADAAKTAAAAAQTKANSAYTEATKAASTTVAGRVQLSDAVDGTSTTRAATENAVKKVWDKAVAAGGVKLKGTRTSKGTWTLTGLTVGKPLFVLHSSVTDNINNAYVYISVLSGSNDAIIGGTSYRYLLGRGTVHGTNILAVIPTAASVSFEVLVVAGDAGDNTLRAYQ